MLLLLAYVLGFLAAIPIGATQVEIAKRSLADHMAAAAMVVVGSVASDVMYGAIALFGLAPLLSERRVLGVFGIAGALVLLALAAFTLRHAVQTRGVAVDSPALRSLPASLATGFTLAVTNPPIMFWWLVGVKIARDLGLAHHFGPRLAVGFLAAGGLGLGSYLLALALMVRRLKHMISPRTQHRVQLVLGALLVLLAAYLLATGIHDLRA